MGQLLETDMIAGLNEAQSEAVLHFEGPMLVLAGAGSGKTRVLTARIARLIEHHGVDPSRILAVTFTNKAAGEMRERISRLLGGDPKGMWAGTFHAIGARLLRSNAAAVGRTPNFTIYDEDDSLGLVKRVMDSLKISPKTWSPKVIMSLISDAKNALVSPDEYTKMALDPVSRNAASVYRALETALRAANAVTFDDLLTLPVEILQRDPALQKRLSDKFQFILVDEYQDTNRAQYRLIKLLGEHGNVMVVGDDDQCLLGGTMVTTADGGTVPIESIRAGDRVRSAFGSGRFGASLVTKVAKRSASEGVAITFASGRKLVSTREHTHFAGYRLGATPQLHFVYMMYRGGKGYRIGTSQVYTRGQAKPVGGIIQRSGQEHADAVWVIGTHATEAAARTEEYLLSLRYRLPTLPFVARKTAAGASGEKKPACGIVCEQASLDKIFSEIDTTEGGMQLLADRGLSRAHPHYVPQSVTGSRRNVTLTLCGDRRGARPMHRIAMVGNDSTTRSALQELGLSVRAAKASSDSWRHETANINYRSLISTVEKIAARLQVNVVQQARLGKNDPLAPGANSLPFTPASSVQPGMVMFDGDGDYDVVVRVEPIRLDEAVYDIDVADTHNFIANGIVTHNSIYGWRGADIRNILDFEREFTEARVVRLEENYRSTPEVLALANAAISPNTGRKGKTLRATRPAGERATLVAALDDRDEADWVVEEIMSRMAAENRSARDFAILYRTNSQSRSLEDSLRRQVLPYRLVGAVRFYDRREIRDLMSYLKLIANPADNEAFRRAVAVPKRGIGDTSIETLAERARDAGVPMLEAARRDDLQSELRPAARVALNAFATLIGRLRAEAVTRSVDELLRDLIDAIRYGDYLRADAPEQAKDRAENVAALIDGATETVIEDGGEVGLTPLDHFLQRAMLVAGTDQLDPSADAVTMMTMHNAKGLEFPVIFITGIEDGLFPTSQSFDDPAKMEEERRLFYVGITRAEEKLYLSHAESRRRNGEIAGAIPSRFLRDIPREMLDERSTLRMRTSGRKSWGSTETRRQTHDVPVWKRPRKEWEEESQDEPSYVRGERVRHATFGTGTIVDIGGIGRDLKATIAFDDEETGNKTIKLAYTTLERE